MSAPNKLLSPEETAELAAKNWKAGYYCAESVLAAVATSQGIESELIPKIASAFCSGLAQTNGPCGAMTGGVMGLSLCEGRMDARDGREKLYQKTQRLVDSFSGQFGDTYCTKLLQLQLGTREASQEYAARNLSVQCEDYVREAARMAVELIQEG
ncbi:MAG: C-GCAxxG-C-C family protein [Anaerolineales bacterium]|jgi:C_GCAxxG_C_C family probable redox protein